MRAFTLALLLLTACSHRIKPPELGGLYSRAAQDHHAERNPVIVIPGILGSRLVTENGRVVWGAFSGDYAKPSKPDGARLVALPMGTGRPLHELADGVRPDGATGYHQMSVEV